MAEAPRPSPEALLAATRPEGRGKLKIFLGASPGVGKTFAMLEAARSKARDGVDVVVGLVETHGRVETERSSVASPSLRGKPSTTGASRCRNSTSTPCSPASPG